MVGALVIVGRAPLNRYGGEKISWFRSGGTGTMPPPGWIASASPLAPCSTVPSGISSDTEW